MQRSVTSFHCIYTKKYDEYDELHIVFDRYGIPKSLKSATMLLRLGNSYPVAYHSTDTTNISLRKLLSDTATKDELTVFSSKELLLFSNQKKSCILLHGKIKQRHHVGVKCKPSQQRLKKKLILHAVDAVKMVQHNVLTFAGHRCICSLPTKIFECQTPGTEGEKFNLGQSISS